MLVLITKILEGNYFTMAKRCSAEEICLHYFPGNAYSWNVIASIHQKKKWHLRNNDWQILATFAKITYRKIAHIKAVCGEKTMHLGKVFHGTRIEERMWITLQGNLGVHQHSAAVMKESHGRWQKLCIPTNVKQSMSLLKKQEFHKTSCG